MIFFLVKYFQLLLIHFLPLAVSILQAWYHAKSLFFFLPTRLHFVKMMSKISKENYATTTF